jgi:hypothetical protein
MTMTIGARSGGGLLLLVAAALPACDEGTDPRSASWDYISAAIMQPSCATTSCHGPAAAVAGLDFSDADRGYTSLTKLWVWVVDPTNTLTDGCRVVDGVRVCQRTVRPLVNPYNPAQSRMMHVLRAEGAPRMPPDRPLTEADTLLIERWVLEGALRHPGDQLLPDAAPGDAAPGDAAPGDAAPGDAAPAETMDGGQ